MSNQHTVSTDALDTLGSVIDERAGRDAIHLAVEPVIAGVDMAAGDHVVMRDGKAYSTALAGTGVGIVDPFLPRGVKQGQMFWLVVYPRTITSLRHVWTHPAFAEPAAPKEPSTSEAWMRAWAKLHMSDDYYGDRGTLSDEEAYGLAIRAGHTMSVGPYEDARDYIDATWWAHWTAITGQPGEPGEYFSCAC